MSRNGMRRSRSLLVLLTPTLHVKYERLLRHNRRFSRLRIAGDYLNPK